MKKYILIPSLAIMGLIVSCSGDKNATEETTATPESAVENVIAPASTNGEQQPSMTTDQPAAEPAVINATAAPSNVATIPNPAHGEPKHRCEVPVGTPIPADGSAPAVTAQAQPQNMQMQSGGVQATPMTASPGQMPTPAPAPASIMSTPGQSGTAPATTAAGMNPPHGQPGHDCAIPVGAPLKK